MIDLNFAAAAFIVFATASHLGSCSIAAWRARHPPKPTPLRNLPPVSIVRPVRGIDTYDAVTLNSTFELDYPKFEIIFCAQSRDDTAVALVEALIRKHPHVTTRLLIGDHLGTQNPKLNNIAKGWRAARHDWVILADSNVLMPPNYIQQMINAWQKDTGLVCSPPAGSHPENFAAEIECAFLNTHQARWQLSADTLGYGFAQGKSMLWRKARLDAAGGIEKLASEIAEDAAATKVVRATGKRVRLVDRFFQQPLGERHFSDVWDRQLRWAQLRRQSFPLQFAPEILCGAFVPLAALTLLLCASGVPAATTIVAIAAFLTVWYGAEAALARASGWPLTRRSPLAWLVRDALFAPLWISAWLAKTYSWRGNTVDMTATVGTDRHAR